jgi:hypothetical protein
MRYLTVAPDYTGSCVVDDYNGILDYSDLGVNEYFITELKAWNARYRKIIPLDESERKKLMDEIKKLDEQGIAFSKRLAESVPGGAKVKYFSEGTFSYLD